MSTARRPSFTLSSTRSRRAIFSMSQNSDEQKSEEVSSSEQEDGNVSFWGVTSFAIMFAIFALAILASLARDFVPGGMVGPA
ncbi:hypothetical protein FGB62_68g035 [Gracilaria domingensis]|nr:hypothetical protein FGB62_68g035 [Gracilaria domingensis]